MNDKWNKAQAWELDWHGDCVNSFHEEEKQFVYAEKMGLEKVSTPKSPHNFDLKGKTILDIGSGAYSILLKCLNIGKDSMAVDPLMDKFPEWVIGRYNALGVLAITCAGEEIDKKINKTFDEVWIYNVLEHTYNPKKLLDNALELGKVLRIFEWLETRANVGHPQTLYEDKLNEWLSGTGRVESIKRGGAQGKAYYGVFKGKNYGT